MNIQQYWSTATNIYNSQYFGNVAANLRCVQRFLWNA